ncbi:putative PKHD-type hydroxylase [Ananas comosus]|uniref:Putative PKHD-type hydroxylase n=1 Tax=Ananas comosus TaxID=4615 RepID=A0A199V1W7_ANACO|nr:putative PKHD-type hydroxylase [Ananas comosus]
MLFESDTPSSPPPRREPCPPTARRETEEPRILLRRGTERERGSGSGGGGGDVRDRRLRLNPNKEHKPERYDDLQSEFDPLAGAPPPPSMLEVPREAKAQFMKRFSPVLARRERTRVQRHKEYRQKIFNLSPLHKELYNIHPSSFSYLHLSMRLAIIQ